MRKPPLFSRPIFGHPLNNGLVADWQMNEGAGLIIQDYSGNSRNGILVNNPTWAVAKNGTSIKFDSASQQYISISNTGGKLTYSQLTVIAYGIWNNSTNISPFAAQWPPSGSTNCWALGCFGYQNRPGFVIDSNNTEMTAGGSPAYTLQNNTYYHLAGTWDGSVISFYLNGILKDSKALVANPFTPAYNILLGTQFTKSRWLNGSLIRTSIWGKALSISEIQRLYFDDSIRYREDI